MSEPTYINWVNCIAGEDLTGYEGREVAVSSTGVVTGAGTVDQATTDATVPGGILVRGGASGEAVEVIAFDGVYRHCIAGTGGLAVGDQVVPEYAASGLDRGRFIAGTIGAGDYVRGIVLMAAAEDAEAVVLGAVRKA